MRDIPVTFGRRLRAALIGGGVAALLALTGVSATALAADQPNAATTDTIGAHTHQIHGVVKTAAASGSTSFVVTTQRYGDVTVTFAGATPRGRGHAGGHARSFEVASASALTVGERVVILGHTSTDGKTFVARRVHALPAAGHATHTVGTITSVTTGTSGTTLVLDNGTSVTVTSSTRIRPEGKTLADLKVGTRVTVVSKDGVATGVVVMPA